MAVFHIVEKALPSVAVRTVRNRNSALLLLSHLGDDFEIVEDLCTEIRQKTVDVLAEHAYNMDRELRKTYNER